MSAPTEAGYSHILRMKRIIFAILCSIFLLSSCKKDKSPDLHIAGSWELTMLEGTSVPEELSVWLDFSEDGTIAIYQRADPEAFYRRITGSWYVTGRTLSGIYDDGSAWASEYEITISGTTMTLTSPGNEVTVYTRQELPDTVTDNVGNAV